MNNRSIEGRPIAGKLMKAYEPTNTPAGSSVPPRDSDSLLSLRHELDECHETLNSVFAQASLLEQVVDAINNELFGEASKDDEMKADACSPSPMGLVPNLNRSAVGLQDRIGCAHVRFQSLNERLQIALRRAGLAIVL